MMTPDEVRSYDFLNKQLQEEGKRIFRMCQEMSWHPGIDKCKFDSCDTLRKIHGTTTIDLLYIESQTSTEFYPEDDRISSRITWISPFLWI